MHRESVLEESQSADAQSQLDQAHTRAQSRIHETLARASEWTPPPVRMPARTATQYDTQEDLDFTSLVDLRAEHENERAKKGLKRASAPSSALPPGEDAPPVTEQIGASTSQALQALGHSFNRTLRAFDSEPVTAGLARQVRHTGTAVVSRTTGNAANAQFVSAGKADQVRLTGLQTPRTVYSSQAQVITRRRKIYYKSVVPLSSPIREDLATARVSNAARLACDDWVFVMYKGHALPAQSMLHYLSDSSN
jgi:hypothetical protein